MAGLVAEDSAVVVLGVVSAVAVVALAAAARRDAGKPV
jgi:hypothetical protein